MQKHKLASLEYNVVWQCTNSCRACSHLAPINPHELVPLDVFEESVNLAARVVDPVMFKLIGGEPLLHPEIVELAAIAKASGISPDVIISTNGVLLDKQSDAFWEADFDALRITRYPDQVTDKQWFAWKRKAGEHGKKFQGGPQDDFYKPIIKKPSSVEDTYRKFTACPWKDHCTTLDRDCLYICPQALFFPLHFEEVEPDKDELCLYDCSPGKVAQYMHREEPMEACKKYSYYHYVHWKQVPRKLWVNDSSYA